MTRTTLGAIVVHHRSYGTIGKVLSDLMHEGMAPEDIVVVDNSDQDGSEKRLRELLPGRARLLTVPNLGYGAAVNAGVRELMAHAPYDLLLVATHEVEVAVGSVNALVEAMRSAPNIGAAGPTLVTKVNGIDKIWSTGGRFTTWARVPRHFDHQAEVKTVQQAGPPTRRDWLDGAFVLYRAHLLSELGVNEIFFMYVEEVDLHLRIARAGCDVVWVPEARVRQSSNGTPPYYFGRNLALLHRLNGESRRLVLLPFVALRAALPPALRRRSLRPVIDVVHGIVRGLTERTIR
ncbi:glycosyltransferase family 2 protein [Curtobacterium albidum]|uniref:glycosyltransferase family 2 protein n=1 Tax=Curtobacterium citreum TaxID=2036 RepID=UPI002026436F|nr:glycosyltransferase family 2 protein [Curtobacterium albidum]MCL9664419.1 glycosyltransferase family 2 protein [Curtobacterium albidum]